ncbi:Rab family GTPase [Pseudanabaena mucicola]|uniref:GTP-binding protein n=1 Tax=Pseudanabaena mucicola FACHB-723 TaxID=2692860 RepID=A0ABR8A068_9CYAN|nr:Rab family GTPase [Pseudanabaena mucicola]MBD2189562.1 GTP-binding protein [Pseudanabaena mucicola FACHB-723]
MHSPAKIISQKICLIGDFGVGKTSLIRQFVDRQFSDKYLSTVGVKISRRLVIVDKPNSISQIESHKLQLMIWDIEGSTRFKSISPSYLQGAKGALIVGDVTRLSSIQNLKDHVQLFQSINPKSSLIIALNKTDLIESNEKANIVKSINLEFSSLNIPVQMTSAKTGEGVDEAFQKLSCQMLMLE